MDIFYGYVQHQGREHLPLLSRLPRENYQHQAFSLSIHGEADGGFFENDHAAIYLDGQVQLHGKNDIPGNHLIQLYEHHGSSFIEHLSGEFCLVLWDKHLHYLICYRDHFGARPFYYSESHGFFMFSNDLKTLKKLTDNHTFSDEWLCDLLAGTISGKHVTPFRDIYRLPPAHSLLVSPDKSPTIHKYWELKLHQTFTAIDEHEAIEQFRLLLTSAVRKRIAKTGQVGAELSGGLDSTVVASLANRMCFENHQKFHAFSHIMEDDDLNTLFPFKDERDYIAQVVDFAQINHHQFIRPGKATILDALENSLEVQGAPTQQRFYEFSDLLYDAAKQNNVSVLFSGFGGDEGVSSQAGGYLQEYMYRHQWEFLHRELFGRDKSTIKAGFKWLLLALQVHFRGVYNVYTLHYGTEYQRIHQKIKQLPLRKDILKTYDIHRHAQHKSRFPTDVILKNRQYQRIMHPHVSERMEYSAIAARASGLEYRYPLWDKDLIQFYINLPPSMKKINNTGRYIYRKSVQGIIPESIRWRSDKTGATIPSVYRRLLNDAENIHAFLDTCIQNGIGTDYFDMKRMKTWLNDILNINGNRNMYQGMFFNYLMFLKYLEWQYEGKV